MVRCKGLPRSRNRKHYRKNTLSREKTRLPRTRDQQYRGTRQEHHWTRMITALNNFVTRRQSSDYIYFRIWKRAIWFQSCFDFHICKNRVLSRNFELTFIFGKENSCFLDCFELTSIFGKKEIS